MTKFSFGGSEVRAVTLAKLLSEKKNRVSFITFDHQQRIWEKYKSIYVWADTSLQSIQTVDNNIVDRIIRFIQKLYVLLFHNISLWKEKPNNILNVVNADIYVTFGVGDFTAKLFQYCRENNKKTILFLGSDLDVSIDYFENSTIINRYGSKGGSCFLALCLADKIIVQNNFQKNQIEKRFSKSSTYLPNPILLDTRVDISKREIFTVLWIGKSDIVKRPDLILQVAKLIPEVSFIIVLNNSDSQMHTNLLHEFDKLSNVEIIEYVPIEEIELLFASCHILVNTSVFEGFPNTFLQAAKYGLPVISMQVDPNNFIKVNNCGTITGDNLEKLVETITSIRDDIDLWRIQSNNIMEYVKNSHSITNIEQELFKIIDEP